MSLIKYNLYALVLVFISRYLAIPMDHFNSDIGNYLWLPMGAVILSYLVFGPRVFLGVFLGYLLAEVVIEGGTTYIGQTEVMSRLVNSLLPLLTIMALKALNLGDFIQQGKLNYRLVLPLIVVASFATTLTKMILLYAPAQFSAGKVYFQSYMIGDVIGGTVFVVLVFSLLKNTLQQHKII